VLEGGSAKDFLHQHNLARVRVIHVKPDPNHPGYVNVPVYDRLGRYANWFKVPPTNPKGALRERLQHLLQTRRGYGPGDIFVSPWGRFLVTDLMGIKEI